MKNQFLEAGQIVNTHGIRGEVKIVPWCDSPEFLCQFEVLYLDGRPLKVRSARAHKGNVLAFLEGVDDVNAAMALKGKIVSIDRTGVELPDGRHFIADLIGLEVLDADDESYNVMNFLYDVVYHMFLTGTVFKDGDTFGFGPEQVLTVNRSAGVSLDGYTLKLQYPGRRDTGSGSEGYDDVA